MNIELIYPNKFKLITDESQIDGDGLYYIIGEGVDHPKYNGKMRKIFETLIARKLEEELCNPAGVNNGLLINWDTFTQDFFGHFDVRDWQFTRFHMNDFYNKSINPIKVEYNKIMLWGNRVVGRFHDIATITSVLTILQYINILSSQFPPYHYWVPYTNKILALLEKRRFIYHYEDIEYSHDTINIVFSPFMTAEYIHIGGTIDELKKEYFDLLKLYVK